MFGKSFLAVALMCGIGLLAGCDSMTKKDDMTMKKDGMTSANPKDNLVVITGAHGATATFAYDAGASKAKMMSSTGDMTKCTACMADVDKYYTTGMIDPVCKECGAKRMVVSDKTGNHGM